MLCIFQYGSQVYGTINELSDLDYVVVVNDDYVVNTNPITVENCDFNFYNETEWLVLILINDIVTLECLSLDNPIKDLLNYRIKIDKIQLRKSISSVASNSFVKCKKKLTIEKDYNPYIGKKSLWHSLRILSFGIQCCKHSKIVDFSVANELYQDIVVNQQNDWEYYKKHYKPMYNNLKTIFKTYSEKEWIKYNNEGGYKNGK